MSELPRGPLDADDMHYSEIIEHDVVLDSLRERIREVECLLRDGAITYGDDEFTALAQGIENDWPYINTPVRLFAKLRAMSGVSESGSMRDTYGEYAIPGGSTYLTAWGVAFMLINNSNETRAVYLFSNPGAGVDGMSYYCLDEDIFSLQFEQVAPESLAWQLEKLVPEVVRLINDAVDSGASLTDKIRAIESISFAINPKDFGDFDIIEKLSTYLNNRLAIDHHVMHNFELEGSLIITGRDGEGDEVSVPATLHETLAIAGYIGAVRFTLSTQKSGEQSYVPWLTLYTHTEVHGDEDDDVLHMEAATLRAAASVRPKLSLARSIATGGDGEQQTIPVQDLAVVKRAEVVAPREPRYYEKMRYYQTLIQAARELTEVATQVRYSSIEAATVAAETLHQAIIDIFGDDWAELTRHTYVADGIGISIPNYIHDGFEQDAEGELTGAIVFRPNNEQTTHQNLLMRQLFVAIDGIVPCVDAIQEGDGDVWYQVGVEVCAKSLDQSTLYRQAIPGTARLARDIHVTKYVYVALDDTASLLHVDLHDLEQFSAAMERFERKLQDMPDLTPSYRALRKLQRAMFRKREDGELTMLDKVELLATLGRQGGGDPQAAELIVDTLSDLLGANRRVSVVGEVYHEGEERHIETVDAITGVITGIVSTYADCLVEEPMFVFTRLTERGPARMYVPLSTIREFHF